MGDLVFSILVYTRVSKKLPLQLMFVASFFVMRVPKKIPVQLLPVASFFVMRVPKKIPVSYFVFSILAYPRVSK